MNAKKRSNSFRGYAFVVSIILALVLSACAAPARQAAEDFRDGKISAVELQATLASLALQDANAAMSQTPGPSATPDATEAPAAVATVEPAGYEKYTPDWDSLTADCPTEAEVLAAHGLNLNMLENDQLVPSPTVSWEPCLFVIELKEEFHGTNLPLLRGFQYTAALTDETVQIFFGGNGTEVKMLWGTTIRWGPTYVATHAANWLDPDDPRELAVRENRFGRYRRSAESGLPGLPYFNRWGPYNTQMGNLDIDWTPPALDSVEPQNYLDAAAMLGGLAREDEWLNEGDNWRWRYGEKVDGSGTYCPEGDPCWQTVYIPPASTGYVELWDGDLGGPRKFYANELDVLLSGKYNVDEFSYLPFGNP